MSLRNCVLLHRISILRYNNIPTICVSRNYYIGASSASIDDIKSQFQHFKGGSVDLVKNEETKIAELKLNHPEKCNAVTGYMMCNLHDALEELSNWKSGKALVIHSEPCKKNFFCSGGHLETVRALNSHEAGYLMSKLMNRSATILRNLPLITVSLIEGPALGGGAELSSLTDFRLGVHDSYVAFVQSKMGVATGFGGGRCLVRIIGYARALDLLLTGRKLSFEEGLKIGYFDKQVTKEHAVEECREWLLQRVQHLDPILIKTSKAILRQEIEITGENRNIAEEEFESRLFAQVWFGESHQAALKKQTKF